MTAARQGKIGRMKTRPEFLRAARKGKKWVSPGFVLQAVQRSQDPRKDEEAREIHVGFTSSRKVGGAVERNRARRRLRAAADAVLPRAGRPGRDYVLIARRGTLDVSFDRLIADLERGVAKLAETEQ
jgi:ribonuclease P protein component